MKLFVIALAVGFATPAFAEEFPIKLVDGASWTITAEHTRKSSDPAPAQNWSLTTVKRLTWHAGKAGEPSMLTVTPVSATPGAGSPAELAQARSLAIPATLHVGDGLEPGEVVNREEVRAEFVRLAPNAKGADARLIDASAMAMVATELAMTAHGQGTLLKRGSPVSGEVAMANPLGGPPLKGLVTITLEAVDTAAGMAKIAWSQASEPASFKAVVAEMLADLGKRQLPPDKLAEAKAALDSASYDNRTECRFDIDTRTGLARRSVCTATNTVSMQGKTQSVVDQWTIAQTPPDKT